MTVVMTAVMTPTWTLDLHFRRIHQGLKEGGGGGGEGGGGGGGEGGGGGGGEGGGEGGGGRTRWEERNSIRARCTFNFCDL